MTENKSEKPKEEKLNKEKIKTAETKFAIPGGRGNYTADLVAEVMEKREEEKERNMRAARGLPIDED